MATAAAPDPGPAGTVIRQGSPAKTRLTKKVQLKIMPNILLTSTRFISSSPLISPVFSSMNARIDIYNTYTGKNNTASNYAYAGRTRERNGKRVPMSIRGKRSRAVFAAKTASVYVAEASQALA
jgi:hypothetical protein